MTLRLGLARRFLARVFLLACASLLLMPPIVALVLFVAPAEADAAEKRSYTWNVLSHLDWKSSGDPIESAAFGLEKMDLLTFLTVASSPNPAAFSLQELCRTQFNWLLGNLSAAGYQGRFVTTKPGSLRCSAADPSTVDAGIAVFFKGNFVFQHDQPYANQDPSDGDLRRPLCVRANTFLGDYAQCSTHLRNNGGPGSGSLGWTVNQNFEAHNNVETLFSDIQRIMGADLNLDQGWSSSNGLGPPWPNYNEAWLGQYTIPPPPGSGKKKLDWLMGDSWHQGTVLDNDRVFPFKDGTSPTRYYSDHAILSAKFDAK